MLIRGLKFDLWIYVLLFGVNPLWIFIHKEGLARLATHEYQTPETSNLTNLCMHLTNYAINKYDTSFKQPLSMQDQTDSHKLSLGYAYEVLQA